MTISHPALPFLFSSKKEARPFQPSASGPSTLFHLALHTYLSLLQLGRAKQEHRVQVIIASNRHSFRTSTYTQKARHPQTTGYLHWFNIPKQVGSDRGPRIIYPVLISERSSIQNPRPHAHEFHCSLITDIDADLPRRRPSAYNTAAALGNPIPVDETL